MSRIAFVVARDRRGVIGKDGRLPWRLPDDLRHVRKLTVGKPLIMGRRTFDSIGRPLPDRTNIVLTRDEAFRCDGCLVARSPDEALALAGDAPEVIVFGGAGVFADFLARTERIYLTEVDAEVAGDTYFPPLDPTEWRETERETHPADPRHQYGFDWVTLERVRG
ncbi:MAG TPA: dihydrofolate reductase [Candidatus Limnocylindria bacterium]|nr:dihydrofolate reductase [Candidatus Limnocylindria bacterium]